MEKICLIVIKNKIFYIMKATTTSLMNEKTQSILNKCNCYVLSWKSKGFKTFLQMLNFIPTPHVVMNELFCEPRKHNHLHDVIDMFTLHIYPQGTQKTYQHFDKVNTWTLKEIANSDIISIVIRKNIVNSSIPRWRDINSGENNALEK
jgi:hypothetical protein